MPDDTAMLRAVPLFSHLDEPRLSFLLDRSSVRVVAAGAPAAVREAGLVQVEPGAVVVLAPELLSRRFGR